MSALRDAITRTAEPADDDRLALCAAEVWATPQPELCRIAAKLAGILADESATRTEQRVAALALDAVETARRGEVPAIATMRAVGIASTALLEDR